MLLWFQNHCKIIESMKMGAEIWAKNSLFLSEDHENRSSRFVCLLMNSVRVFPFLLWEKVLLAPNVIWLAERIKQGLKSLKRCVIMHNNAIFKSTFSSQLSLNVSEGCVHNSPKHFWKLHFKLQRFKHLLLVLTSHHKEQNKSQKKKKSFLPLYKPTAFACLVYCMNFCLLSLQGSKKRSKTNWRNKTGCIQAETE